jgi:hypothetical protein
MKDMIERVKAAIFGADCDFGYSIRLTGHVDGVSEYTLTYSDGSEPLTFADYAEASEHTESRRNEVRARAAIEAMREPTETMRQAGADNLFAAASDDWKDDAGGIWTAMIDAALHRIDGKGE